MNVLRLAALEYAERGWFVIPLTAVDIHTSYRRKCVPHIKWDRDWLAMGKKPTTDDVSAFWDEWPDARIALATGAVSNLWVLGVKG